MLKAELEMLEGLKNALNAALIDYDRNHDPEPLYELIEEADALYGADVSEITSALEMAKHYHGTIKRQSMLILRLLQRKYIQEESAFQAGIMPITYENLIVCPRAQEVYKSGITKYTAKNYERNILDDMRLSLELLVKQFLGNEKSLENQVSMLGTKLNQCGISSELRNLLVKVIDYFCKYQNNYVKHNDAVNPAEIDFVIEQTSTVINLIVKFI